MENNYLQSKLDKIVNDVVILEDEITSLTNKMKNFESDKQNYIENLKKETEKFNEKTLTLQNLIKTQQEKEAEDIRAKEEEKIRIVNYIKEIEDEIFNLKNKDLEKIKEKEKLEIKFLKENFKGNFTLEELQKKKKQAELETIETAKKNLELKKSMVNVEIQKLKHSEDSLNENLCELNYKKENYENQLVNLISQKETLEEILKNVSITKINLKENKQNVKANFKASNFNENFNSLNVEKSNDFQNFQTFNYESNNEMNTGSNVYAIDNDNDNDSNLTSSGNYIKNVEINFEDLKIINKAKLGSSIYDYLNELDPSNVGLLDKQNFENAINPQFESCIDSQGIFTTEDIVLLITKSIFDFFTTSKKFSENNPFSSEKMRNFLKYFLKILCFESQINQRFDFINKEFPNLLHKIEEELKENSQKISEFNNQIEKLNFKQKSVGLNSPSKNSNLFDDSENAMKSPYLKAVEKLEIKLLELIELKNEIDLELIEKKTTNSDKVDTFKTEIKQNENFITEIKSKQTLVPFEIENNRIKYNDKIIILREEISEKFHLIREIFKNSEHNLQKNENNLVDSCINKIRKSVNELKKSNEYNDEINNNFAEKINNINLRSSILSGNNNNTPQKINLNENSNNFSEGNFAKSSISSNLNLCKNNFESNSKIMQKHYTSLIPYSVALKNSSKKTSKISSPKNEKIFEIEKSLNEEKEKYRKFHLKQESLIFDDRNNDNKNSMNFSEKVTNALNNDYVNEDSNFVYEKLKSTNGSFNKNPILNNSNLFHRKNKEIPLNDYHKENLYKNNISISKQNLNFNYNNDGYNDYEGEIIYNPNDDNFYSNKNNNIPNSQRNIHDSNNNFYYQTHREQNPKNFSNNFNNNQENELNFNYENQSEYGTNRISKNPSINSFYSHKAIRGNPNYNLHSNNNDMNFSNNNSNKYYNKYPPNENLNKSNSINFNNNLNNQNESEYFSSRINKNSNCNCSNFPNKNQSHYSYNNTNSIPHQENFNFESNKNCQFCSNNPNQNSDKEILYRQMSNKYENEAQENFSNENICRNCSKENPQKENFYKKIEITKNKSNPNKEKSYLNEKYVSNKKKFEENKLNSQKNLKEKGIKNSNEKINSHLTNPIKKRQKNLSILSEKEILDNSIKNLKSEININGDIDKINSQIKENNISSNENMKNKNKKNFENFSKIPIRKNEEKNRRSNTTYNTENDLYNLENVNSISGIITTQQIVGTSIYHNNLKENAESKMRIKLLEMKLSNKLLKGEMANKVN